MACSSSWVVTSIIQTAEASQKRINEFLQEIPEIQGDDVAPSRVLGNISFQNVRLTYDDTNIEALKGISFYRKGRRDHAILGKTGSGKSSIVNLISRLYDVTSGQISVDGIPITQLT